MEGTLVVAVCTEESGGLGGAPNAAATGWFTAILSKVVTKSETLSPPLAHDLDPGQTRRPLVGGYKPWLPGCVDPQGWPRHAQLDGGWGGDRFRR